MILGQERECTVLPVSLDPLAGVEGRDRPPPSLPPLATPTPRRLRRVVGGALESSLWRQAGPSSTLVPFSIVQSLSVTAPTPSGTGPRNSWLFGSVVRGTQNRDFPVCICDF